VVINSQTIAQRGVWYHVVATYDGNQAVLYVNGVAEASATPGFSLDYDTTPLFIGTTGTWAPYLNMFGGIIDEVSIYNRALSAPEILSLYNAGSAGKCLVSIATQPASQTVYSGSTLSLSVTASGLGPFSYQWQLNGTNLPSGIINTFAGTGTAGYSGDDIAATSSRLNLMDPPCGVTVDILGNLFVADTANNRIRKVNTNGVIMTVAGNGTAGYTGNGGAATNASFSSPAGIVVDASGNLFIADWGNNVIRKVATNGIITAVAGTGTAGYSGDGGLALNATLKGPNGIAVDAFGNLFIADTDNNRIRKVNTNGIIATVAGNGNAGYSGDGGLATNATLNAPTTVVVDSSGNLFISDFNNNRIREVYSNGVITTIAGNGSAGYSGDGSQATNASLSNPLAAALDGAGNLFIADTYNSVIREVTPSGIITTVAGDGVYRYTGDGGPATSASVNRPAGITADISGNIFISDTYNNRIRIITSSRFPTLTLYNFNGNYAGNYTVVVSNSYGCVTSTTAVASVYVPPSIITTQPISQAVFQGNSAIFTVSATGTGLQYQWRKNGAIINDGGNITGTKTSTLNLSNVQAADAGIYTVDVSNGSVFATSLYAMLRVWAPASVFAWGGVADNLYLDLAQEDIETFGQANVPPGLTSVVAIAAGGYWSVALNSNRTITGWGWNGGMSGQTQVFSGPADLTNVVAVASGFWDGIALKNDGTVVALSYPGSFYSLTIPPGLNNVVAIAAGYSSYFALKNDGTVVGWGDSGFDNSAGQINIPAGLSNVIAVAADFALKTDGTVVAWGASLPAPPGLVNVTSIGSGPYDGWVFKNDGTFIIWGSQTNVPTGLTGLTAIAEGLNNKLAIRNDGTVVAWGDNSYGETMVTPGLVNAIGIAAGRWHCVALGNMAACPLASLLATGVSPTQMNLHWTATSGSVVRFHIERKPVNGSYQEIAAVPGTATSYLDTAVNCTNQYFYRIKAEYASGQSGYSAEVSPPSIVLAPAIPPSYYTTGSTYPFTVQTADAFSFPTNLTIINGLNASNVLVSSSTPVTTRCTLNGSFIGSSNYLYVPAPLTNTSPPSVQKLYFYGPLAPFTTSWSPSAQRPYVLSAIVADGLGNSAISTLTLSAYLDSNGDGIPDIVQIGQGNDPLNPWIPPAGDTNTTPPNINLLVPANAQLQ
jgi:Concanavalin A-like lectin/glucanases superfamily/Immunoglobulin domain/Regulator of chromosome condensation (RCC1) repeat